MFKYILKFTCFLSLVLLISCSGNKNANTETEEIVAEEVSPKVEVVTTGMNFNLVDEVPSGWTTFSYRNQSADPHFFIFEKMPDTLTIEDYKRDLIPPFIAAFKFFDEGNIDAGMAEFGKIPEWFSRVELGGGVGLTSPNTISESTIYLEPGTYVMECYVRMPNGMAHTFMGMLEQLVVTEEDNGLEPPQADASISLSSTNGVSFADSLQAGYHTFSVDFQDQQQYEHMLGHDINLVKLETAEALDSLASWINAGDIKSFRTPAPQGMTFLGGVEDQQAGTTGYFSVSLEPGEYVLISEIPNAIGRNMYKQFSVYE